MKKRTIFYIHFLTFVKNLLYYFCKSRTKGVTQAKAKAWKNSYSTTARKYYGVRYRIVEVK